MRGAGESGWWGEEWSGRRGERERKRRVTKKWDSEWLGWVGKIGVSAEKGENERKRRGECEGEVDGKYGKGMRSDSKRWGVVGKI